MVMGKHGEKWDSHPTASCRLYDAAKVGKNLLTILTPLFHCLAATAQRLGFECSTMTRSDHVAKAGATAPTRMKAMFAGCFDTQARTSLSSLAGELGA